MRRARDFQRFVKAISKRAQPGVDAHTQIVQGKHGNCHFRVQLFGGFVEGICRNDGS